MTVPDIIDTPAEGFPLPTMDPPTRRLRDVAARLTPGGRARAIERALVTGPLDGLDATQRDILEQDAALAGRIGATFASPVFDEEITRRLERLNPNIAAWHVPQTTTPPTPLEALTASMRRQHDADLRNAFNAGRAYQRGDTLRTGASAKSLGSRRVTAQGIAADYLRDDPERGAMLATMVLAGFLGQDPATVKP